MLRAHPELAPMSMKQGASRTDAAPYYFDAINHYVYEGDTALHVAAAAHQPELVTLLIELGANVTAGNRRGAQPLHYAADGSPGSPTWDPARQAAVISLLITAGADPDALDKSGVAPLHRAVRTRCASAVGALLDGGADPKLTNKSGSSPMKLAIQTTGRGGSASPAARGEQAKIVELLEARQATA
jgi:ankyrin repeat protein